MSTDTVSSLLSLSIAASHAAPIPLDDQQDPVPADPRPSTFPSPPISSSVASTHKTHRRLASTGKTRRRLSDAREAASRPSPAILHASPPALSLASLSLSTSPPSNAPVSASLASASNALSSAAQLAPLNDGSNFPHLSSPPTDSTVKPIPIGSAKKRGVEHKCESCSKIYRHPSCLIKHRWEHTPHWREASKFVLSKHQQVQLLEAAAILSHLSPHASSLPEDRSLWPSFLSGGSLPPPDPATLIPTTTLDSKRSAASSLDTSATATTPAAISSSVPATIHTTSSSAGPRMHDYSIPIGAATTGGVAQLRPGLLGIPTGSTSGPSPVATNGNSNSSLPMSLPVTASDSWSSISVSEGGRSGWSLPRSSVRSISESSRSGSASDEESENIDVDGEQDEYGYLGPGAGYNGRYTTKGYAAYNAYHHHRGASSGSLGPKMWKREEDELGAGFAVRDKERGRKGEDKEWDGMEMEMDMD